MEFYLITLVYNIDSLSNINGEIFKVYVNSDYLRFYHSFPLFLLILIYSNNVSYNILIIKVLLLNVGFNDLVDVSSSLYAMSSSVCYSRQGLYIVLHHLIIEYY